MRSVIITQPLRGEVIWEKCRTGGTNSKSKRRAHSATVYYEGHHKYELMEQWWHAWNVPLSEFNDVNLANVKRITIGFAKGEGGGADGTVYFDNIVLTSQPLESDFSGPYSGTSVYLDDEDDPFVFGWGPGNEESWLLLDQNSMLIDRGFGFVDEYRDIIGKTTSYDCRPDSDRMDIGLHYPIWVFEELGSGELLSADLDYSMAVDFSDFAIFADYWQWSTTERADLDGSGFVDYNDLALFAKEWQAENEMFIEVFDFDTLEPMDINNIFGYVGIVPRSIPLDAGKVFVYVDDVQVGSWIRSWNSENESFAFESDRFLNGEHTIRLASENLDGEIINYRLVNADFNNVMYKVSGDEHFHPDENYHYSGFYDGEGFLEVELTGLYGNTIWLNTYSGDYIDINIPGSAFGAEKLCTLNITETTGGMMATMQENGTVMTSSDSGSASKSLKKKFKIEDCAGVRMLIITPTKDIFGRRKPAIIACAEACEARDVIWMHLYYHDVNEGNLTYLYNMDSVKYIYWAGHANSHIGEVQRTHTECWEYKPSWWHFDWQKIGAFSYTGGLPDDWDYKGFNLWSLGMHESWNKKLVFVDGCLSAKYDDMARAYGMYSLQGLGSKDQIYIGWRKEILTVPWWNIFIKPVLKSTDGVKLFWEKMGEGMNVRDALEGTTAGPAGIGIGQTLWGSNGVTDFFNVNGDDNLFLWGQGILTKIKLEN